MRVLQVGFFEKQTLRQFSVQDVFVKYHNGINTFRKGKEEIRMRRGRNPVVI